jgi:tetratricopeptide (TPR) repeat protein
VRLAQVVSLAARIEPELLRQARLKLLPKADAGAEADLWFSPLVQSATPLALVLLPEVSELLRQRLSGSGALLQQSWNLLKLVHENAPAAIRLEEEVTWKALAGGAEAEQWIEQKLMSVVSAIVNQGRVGLARWALRALPNLPDAARRTKGATMLALAAAARLGSWHLLEAQVKSLRPGTLSQLRVVLPPDMPQVNVGVRLFQESDGASETRKRSGASFNIEFSNPPAPEAASSIIEVPATTPLLLEVAWGEGRHRIVRQVSLYQGQTETLEVNGAEIRVRNARGDTYTLRRTDVPRQSPVNILILSSERDSKLSFLLKEQLRFLKRRVILNEQLVNRLSASGILLERGLAGWTKQFANSDIILPLLSADFLASEYHEKSVAPIMARAHSGARVIPVILRPCMWKNSPLAQFKVLPLDGRPVSDFRSTNTALARVAQDIGRVVDELLDGKARHETEGAGVSLREDALARIPSAPVIGFINRRDGNGRDLVPRLKDELASPGGKVLALWGAAGVGKTTLAAEVARGLLEAFRQRVVWINTEDRTAFNFVALLDEIATQLGQPLLRTLAVKAKSSQLLSLLVSAPVLVVLDQFESIPGAEQKRCLDFLKRSGGSALIVTRQRLKDVTKVSLELMTDEETRTFLQRLTTNLADPEQRNRLIQRIFTMIPGGHPLVLQWIVGQLQLAGNSANVFGSLMNVKGGLVENVFNRSFNLPQLGEEGRSALFALSLFVPDASLEALAEVADLGNVQALPSQHEGKLYSTDSNSKLVSDILSRLTTLHMARVSAEGKRVSVEGSVRQLLKTHLQQDARAREFYSRFVVYFLNYAQSHRQPTPEDFDALEAEFENIMAAMDSAFQRKDWQSVIGLCDAVGGFLDTHGYWDESLRRSEQARRAAVLAKLPEPRPTQFAEMAANIFLRRGEYARAERAFHSTEAQYRKAGYEPGIAQSLRHLGNIALEKNDLTKARRLYSESLEISRKLNDPKSLADVLHNLAVVMQAEGKFEQARELYQESLVIVRQLGDQQSAATTLHQLGVTAAELGRLEEARRLYQESLTINEMLGAQEAVGSSLHQLGRLELVEGRRKEAEKYLSEALNIFDALESPAAAQARKELESLEDPAPMARPAKSPAKSGSIKKRASKVSKSSKVSARKTSGARTGKTKTSSRGSGGSAKGSRYRPSGMRKGGKGGSAGKGRMSKGGVRAGRPGGFSGRSSRRTK